MSTLLTQPPQYLPSHRVSIPVPDENTIPPLEQGDRLTRQEFERRYEAMPTLKKAELLDGVVYMPSPVRHRHHGLPHSCMDSWLGWYAFHTKGVDISNNATNRLDEDSEPQPDSMLFVKPEYGGRVKISDDDYVEGSPELIAEISASSVSYDVHVKRPLYEKAGVLEYIIWRIRDGELDWYALRNGAYELRQPDQLGVIHSEEFPGLWLDVGAMLVGDMVTVLAVLQQGLASSEHAAFVAALAANHKPPANP